jgi:hypothetical protein
MRISAIKIRFLSDPFSLICLALGLALVWAGCGDASVEQLNIPEFTPKIEQADTSNQKESVDFEQFVADRKQRGDTIAIPHERLAAMLPDIIPGYQLDIDKAATFETNRFTFSEATRVFYNDKNEYIEFIAGDYVDDPDFFKVNLLRYNLAQDITIVGVKEKKEIGAGIRPKDAVDFFAWSLFNDNRGLYRLYLGLDYRYFVTIEVSGLAKRPPIEDFGRMLVWEKLRSSN